MSFTQVPPNSTGNKIDTRTLVDGADTVHRQVTVLGDPSNPNSVLPVKSTMPAEADNYHPIRQLGPQVFRASFTEAVSNGVANKWDLLQTGSGQTVNQTGGNLVVTTGTTVNSETVIRSKTTFNGALFAKWKSILSQRIANQNFFIELVDKVGDGLAFVINSATSVTVTFPAGTNPFTAVNVGQFINLGVIAGAAGIPGRYSIASVSGDTVTFTVAGWPASGSGTLNLFGWNYYQCQYQGTSATAVNFDAQRNGYASGATAATINTTASPGHVGMIATDNGQVSFLDRLVASSTGQPTATRASREENIPDADINLYLQIRILNGTVAPASTTTWTVGFVQIEDYTPNYVDIAGVRSLGWGQPIPITGGNGQNNAVLVHGTPRGASNNGGGNPLYVATGYSGRPTGVTAGRNTDLQASTEGVLITKPYALAGDDWTYAAASGGIIDTTDVAIKAAAGAGLRNFITGLTVSNAHASVGTEVVIKDGATVIWRDYLAAGQKMVVPFPEPLRGTANTAINAACITTGAQVYVNAQGYIGS